MSFRITDLIVSLFTLTTQVPTAHFSYRSRLMDLDALSSEIAKLKENGVLSSSQAHRSQIEFPVSSSGANFPTTNSTGQNLAIHQAHDFTMANSSDTIIPSVEHPSTPRTPIKTDANALEERLALRRQSRQTRTIASSRRNATPPLSSLETENKIEWPPQYVAPTRSSTRSKTKRRASTPQLLSRGPARSRSSSPEFISAVSCRSQRAKRRADRTPAV